MIKKITPETSLGWKEVLPIALLCTHTAPKEKVGLSPYERLFGRPFVYVNDLFLDPELQILWSYTLLIGQFQQGIRLWGVNWTPNILKSHHCMLQWLKSYLKSGKMYPQRLNSSPHGRTPTYPVILSTPIVVKVPGHDSNSLLMSQTMEWKRRGPSIHMWDLRYLFKTTIDCIFMNTVKIKFLGIIFLRIDLKNQQCLPGVVFQNRQEIDLLIPEQEGTWAILNKMCCFWVNTSS